MPQPLVIGFVAQNDYGVLQNSSDGLSHALRQHNYDSATINLYDPKCYDQLRKTIAEREVFFCYGYAGIGAHLEMGGESLWEKFRIPFLSLHYDNPFYYPAHHGLPTQYVCNCYAIRDFLELQRNYIKSSQQSCELKVSSVGYAASQGNDWERCEWHERIHLGIFLKSGYDLPALEQSFEVMPQEYKSIVWDTIHLLQINGDLVIADIVANRFLNFGVSYNQTPQVWDDFVYLVRVIDLYMRNWRSRMLVEGLKHLPILVIGNGWDHIDKTNCKATFLPSMPIEKAKEYMFRSKFILNTHPYARYGWHERVLFGFELGAAVVSDRTRFTDCHFSDLPNFMGFDWGDVDRFEKVEAFIKKVALKSFDVLPVQARLKEAFPYDATIRQLIDIANKMRAGVPIVG